MSLPRVAAVLAALALAAAGCGANSHPGAARSTAAGGSGGAASSPKQVLACLKSAGLDAKDQSTSMGRTVGIDTPEGRVVITFEDTPEAAASYASIAETNGEIASVKGKVAITIPKGGAAEAAKAKIEGCVG